MLQQAVGVHYTRLVVVTHERTPGAVFAPVSLASTVLVMLW
jgi:hypothetical protein